MSGEKRKRVNVAAKSASGGCEHGPGEHKRRDLTQFITKLGDGRFKCTGSSMACNRVYNSIAAIERHVLRHFQRRPCPHLWCRYHQISFRSTGELQQHIDSRHNVSLDCYPLWFLAAFELEVIVKEAHPTGQIKQDCADIKNEVDEKVEEISARVSEPLRQNMKDYLGAVWERLKDDKDAMRQYFVTYHIYEKLIMARRAHLGMEMIYNSDLDEVKLENQTSLLKTQLVKPRLPKENIISVPEDQALREHYQKQILGEEAGVMQWWLQSVKTSDTPTQLISALFQGRGATVSEPPYQVGLSAPQGNLPPGGFRYPMQGMGAASEPQESQAGVVMQAPVFIGVQFGTPYMMETLGWGPAPRWVYGVQYRPPPG